LGSPNRCAAFRNPHFVGVLLLRVAPDRDSTQWSGRPDIRGGSDFSLFGGHAWCGVVAVASIELGLQ